MPKYRKIPLDQLFIDPDYQRELSQRRVRKMAENYDPAKVNVLEVSARGKDKFAVFDGQHRLEMLRTIEATEAACLVHEGLTRQQEAELFIALQTERKQPAATESFIARLFAEDPKAIAIAAILNKEGVHVRRDTTSGNLNTLAAITAVERVFDAGNLETTIGVIRTLWSEERKHLDANLIESMSLFLALYGPKVDEDKLLDALEGETPTTLIRRATARRHMTGGPLRDLMVEELRSTVSTGPVRLKRPPMTENSVAIRWLARVREVFHEVEAKSNGRKPRLTQSEITELSHLRSADAGQAIRTMLAVGQPRQSGKKKLPRMPESPAYVLMDTSKKAVIE